MFGKQHIIGFVTGFAVAATAVALTGWAIYVDQNRKTDSALRHIAEAKKYHKEALVPGSAALNAYLAHRDAVRDSLEDLDFYSRVQATDWLAEAAKNIREANAAA